MTPHALSRSSALHGAMPDRGIEWTVDDGMPQVRCQLGDEAARLASGAVGELGARRRWGVKGAGAAAWLQARGLQTPAAPNQWLRFGGGDLVLRLGLTEYLVEAAPGSGLVRMLSGAPLAHQVYPVPRFDAALALIGPKLPELLAQTCAIDFSVLVPAEQALVLTSMVGVGVTALYTLDAQGVPLLRLWCDGSYGEYLWITLLEIATSLGGGAIGSDALSAHLALGKT